MMYARSIHFFSVMSMRCAYIFCGIGNRRFSAGELRSPWESPIVRGPPACGRSLPCGRSLRRLNDAKLVMGRLKRSQANVPGTTDIGRPVQSAPRWWSSASIGQSAQDE